MQKADPGHRCISDGYLLSLTLNLQPLPLIRAKSTATAAGSCRTCLWLSEERGPFLAQADTAAPDSECVGTDLAGDCCCMEPAREVFPERDNFMTVY